MLTLRHVDNFCPWQTFCTIRSGACLWLSFPCKVTMSVLEMYYDPRSADIESKDMLNRSVLGIVYFRDVGSFHFMLRHTPDPLSVFCIAQCLVIKVSSARLKGCLNTRMVFWYFSRNTFFRVGSFSVRGCKCAMMF